MSSAAEEKELERLLARDRLSGHRRDEIFEEVMKGVSRRRTRTRQIRWALAGGVAAAAGLILIAGRSRLWNERDHFASRGSGAFGVEILCARGTLSGCPQGSKLLFRFDGVARPAYVRAYARRQPDGERIWYFPSSSTQSALLDGGSDMLDKAVVLGTEHAPGDYKIDVTLSARPLERGEVPDDRADIFYHATLDLRVVAQ